MTYLTEIEKKEKKTKYIYCYFNPIRTYTAFKWLICVLCTVSDIVMLNKIEAT